MYELYILGALHEDLLCESLVHQDGKDEMYLTSKAIES